MEMEVFLVSYSFLKDSADFICPLMQLLNLIENVPLLPFNSSKSKFLNVLLLVYRSEEHSCVQDIRSYAQE